ncbi:hypothetical protein H0H92_003057 [Tricholoma furcatifolium]|nr:hypothetical protein H0H92_003057 [Tricholoma furcatifolium]
MPKFPPKPGKNWLIEVTACTPDGKPIYNPNGTLAKVKIHMGDAILPNGQPQSLYFDKASPQPGIFKGMAEILIERGYDHDVVMALNACWGYAKRVYRLNPESSREDQLVKNSIDALEAVPLDSTRRFAPRSLRFLNAY